MKYGVIDIGSNSVRFLMQKIGEKPIKKAIITKLAKDMNESRLLTKESIERTANTVLFFIDYANEQKVDKLFIFATAAVRNSINGSDFTSIIEERSGYQVDVVDGELEGKLAYYGVYANQDGGIIDVGGASTEIAVYKNGECVYAKSLPIGAVNLTNLFSQNQKEIDAYLLESVKSFGKIPKTSFKTVGGTACNVCSVMLGLTEFDASKVENFIIKKDDLNLLAKRLSKMSVVERENIVGLQKERAENFLSGVLILNNVFDYLGIDSVSHSEKDNLEGYLIYKTENL